MNGLLVKIRGDRRHWRVIGDDGRTLRLLYRFADQWHQDGARVARDVPRSDVTARYEQGTGWTSTEIPA